MSQQDFGVAGLARAFLWSGLWGALIGVAAVLPLIVGNALFFLSQSEPGIGTRAVWGAGVLALGGAACGSMCGFVVAQIRTGRLAAGYTVGPLIFKAAGWAALVAAGVFGVLVYQLPEAPRLINPQALFAAGAATFAGFLAALFRLVAGLDEARSQYGRAVRSAVEASGQLRPHPPSPPEAEAIQPPGRVRE